MGKEAVVVVPSVSLQPRMRSPPVSSVYVVVPLLNLRTGMIRWRKPVMAHNPARKISRIG